MRFTAVSSILLTKSQARLWRSLFFTLQQYIRRTTCQHPLHISSHFQGRKDGVVASICPSECASLCCTFAWTSRTHSHHHACPGNREGTCSVLLLTGGLCDSINPEDASLHYEHSKHVMCAGFQTCHVQVTDACQVQVTDACHEQVTDA